ncbi:hypothetical protein [Microbulbifer sp. 2205BS26-8]|nr:hypothetical protein [Microbulbifer sp. 2205BS26-8]MDP5209356.1 hypothetical protein [Microbulbifer sp. 2205BS26-8]
MIGVVFYFSRAPPFWLRTLHFAFSHKDYACGERNGAMGFCSAFLSQAT